LYLSPILEKPKNKGSLNKPKVLDNIPFYLLAALVVIIPLSFWKGFENSFDLVKAAILYIAGGCFIIFFINSFQAR
jgi:hypothetical protein